jgi:ubiquinone/menaquinone biosynthesis C-methylase UbiE
LIVGAGTGLDLDFLPSNVHVTAIDVTPAMLKHLERRAAGMGRSVTARIMDARQLAFPDSSFDAVVMHLILAVMPEPERGLREAVRVLKPSGRIAVLRQVSTGRGTRLAEASAAQRDREAAVFGLESALRPVDCRDTARH